MVLEWYADRFERCDGMVVVTGTRARHRFARGTSGDFRELYRSWEIMRGIWRSRGDRKNDAPAVDVESRRLCATGGDLLLVFLNGNEEPEIEMESSADIVQKLSNLYLGGKCNSDFNFEGRLDEIGVFDRALNLKEVRSIFPAK